MIPHTFKSYQRLYKPPVLASRVFPKAALGAGAPPPPLSPGAPGGVGRMPKKKLGLRHYPPPSPCLPVAGLESFLGSRCCSFLVTFLSRPAWTSRKAAGAGRLGILYWKGENLAWGQRNAWHYKHEELGNVGPRTQSWMTEGRVQVGPQLTVSSELSVCLLWRSSRLGKTSRFAVARL